MFDLSWSEMLVVAVVALVVIGPKDLPRLVREIGRWAGKARAMARDFQRSFDDMVREAELDDIRKSVDQARPRNLTKTIRDAVDPEGELDEAFSIEDESKGRTPPKKASKPGAAKAEGKAAEALPEPVPEPAEAPAAAPKTEPRQPAAAGAETTKS
jgi:sec-independent protein translocase protein TatB